MNSGDEDRMNGCPGTRSVQDTARVACRVANGQAFCLTSTSTSIYLPVGQWPRPCLLVHRTRHVTDQQHIHTQYRGIVSLPLLCLYPCGNELKIFTRLFFVELGLVLFGALPHFAYFPGRCLCVCVCVCVQLVCFRCLVACLLRLSLGCLPGYLST
jgi:hypothetical protein